MAGADPSGEDSIYSCDEFPPIGQNNLFWCDPILTHAEKQALLSYDEPERRKWYWIAQAEIAQQSPTIIMYFQRQIFITSTSFHGFKPAPATTSNWNTWEWSME